MKRLSVIVLVVTAFAQNVFAEEGAAPPPMMMPTYQMRAPLPEGDRLETTGSGEELFSNRCGSCHLPFGMGTNVLTVQRLALGEPPEMGLLTNREDLGAAYVKAVVRNGKVGMPRLNRVEVTDSELERIADFLGRGKP